ncbi:MAG: M20/M25/M40 family metallo-hydrolase [Lachnospiraceae bacterium]|nr:M20/M25/M40 family metallo-hydrolase [Lachnospiraceae bacterium]
MNDAGTTRIYREFAELTGIDSVSFSERLMADTLTVKLRTLGFEVWEDDAGGKCCGDAGNLYGFLKGQIPGPPILLSAHMDTVTPGIGKRAVLREDGRITSEGETVLGADDVCGLVEILEGVRRVQERGIPHRDVEVLFTVAEEAYGKGASVFEFGRIHAREAYVFDLSGPVGTAALQAPSIISFRVEVRGKAAHAGFEPEKGIHAIQILSEAVSRMKLGHLDEETTLNIGQIEGGAARNIVPERCVCRGEIRSFYQARALETAAYVERTVREAAEGTGAEVRMDTEVHLEAYQIAENAPVVERFAEVCRNLGLPGEKISTFGGSDNNHLVRQGLQGIVLSCGMYRVHSTGEYTMLKDLELGAELAARLIG